MDITENREIKIGGIKMCLRKLTAITVSFFFCTICANVSYPKNIDKTKLVGNIYGIVRDAETGIGLDGAAVFLFEEGLHYSVDDILPFFDSNKGRFILPDFTSAKLQTTTNSEGKFLVNNVPTPFPGKKYTILTKLSGFNMEIIDQVFVIPGASLSLRAEFILSKQENKAVVYYADDQNIPITIGKQIPKTLIKDLHAESYQIYATREGLVGYTTANGHVIQPHDHFVALPSSKSLCSLDGHEFEVELSYNGKTVAEPVWDIGPWNIYDNYWDVEEARDIYQHLHYGGQPGLGQGLPEAQAAFQCYYNKGYSGDLPGYPTGRPVSNPAGIDLADGTFWDSLEMTDNNWISVKYLWVEQSLPLVDWPFIQRDLQNTGNNPDALNLRNPKIKDSLTIEGTWGYAQPIAEGNMVYLATRT